MSKKQLEDAADKYMAASTKRFRERAEVDNQSEFGNGYSWGARAGYLAGYRAAMRKRSAQRRNEGR